MVTMRPPVVAGTIVLAFVLIVASFTGGRYAERQAQKRSGVAANQNDAAAGTKRANRTLLNGSDSNDHVLVANVATVSFAELWDVMRAGAPSKRAEWSKEIEQLPSGPRRNAALKSFYKIWGELDPTAAIEGVEKISDKRMRNMAFVALSETAADSALPAVAELEFRLGRRSSQFNLVSPLRRWSAADPEAVAQFLEAHPNNGSSYFLDVAYGWAYTDPQKAAEWFLNLKLPPLQNPKYPRAEDRRRLEAARGLLQGWLEKDSRGAAEYVSTHANDPDIKKAIGEFGESLFIKSKGEATVFIQSLPNKDVQSAALKEIMRNVGSGLLLWREGGDDEEPEPPEINPDEIPPWFASLPPDVKSKAITDYCASAKSDEASSVFEVTKLIGDPRIHREALQKFVDNLSDNSAEAREKITALPITDEQKQKLLQLIRRQP